MRIAYYAPMKSPHHPRPSGDRLIARLLIKAMEVKRHQIELMSELRSWEGKGNPAAQQQIREQSLSVADEIIHDIQNRPASMRPDVWFCYHPYHKAPDWIGPRVCQACDIPYVAAEAIYAIDHTGGPWGDGVTQIIHTLKQATAILCLNPLDVPALKRLPASHRKLHRLRPFLDLDPGSLERTAQHRQTLAQRYGLDPARPWIISVAMMRDDAKLRSYENMAQVLKNVNQGYQLLLIGDGKARHKIEKLFGDELAATTFFAGQLDQDATLQAMLGADIFLWPAVSEAIGMAILEAQACGLAVVAGNSGAIPEIVQQGESGFLCAPDDHQTMAANIETLLENEDLRQRFSQAAITNFQQYHTLGAAAQIIDRVLYKAVQSTTSG